MPRKGTVYLRERERERERESCGLAQTLYGGVGGAKENIKGVRCARSTQLMLQSFGQWFAISVSHVYDSREELQQTVLPLLLIIAPNYL